MALFKSQKENNDSFSHDNDDVVIITPYEGDIDFSDLDFPPIEGFESFELKAGADEVVIFTPYDGDHDLTDLDIPHIGGLEVNEKAAVAKAAADDANDAVIFSSTDTGGLDNVDLSNYEPMEGSEINMKEALPHIDVSFFETLEGDYSDIFNADIPNIGDIELVGTATLPVFETGDLL